MLNCTMRLPTEEPVQQERQSQPLARLQPDILDHLPGDIDHQLNLKLAKLRYSRHLRAHPASYTRPSQPCRRGFLGHAKDGGGLYKHNVAGRCRSREDPEEGTSRFGAPHIRRKRSSSKCGKVCAGELPGILIESVLSTVDLAALRDR